MTFFISGQKPEPREANVGDVEARAEQVPRARGRTGSRGRPAGLARSQTSRTATSALARRRTLRVQGRAFTGPARSSAEMTVADPHGCGALFVSCHSFTHSFVPEKEGCHQSPYSMLRTGWAQGPGPPPHAGPGPARTGPGGKRTDREPRGGSDGPAEPRTGRRGRRKRARPAAAATSPQPPGLSGDLALRGGGRLAGNRGGSCHSAVSGRAARLAPLRLSGPA